ncbi:hypothetical protein Bbelb_424800 [Branchiostoma belcheri]|nr:hypothetical protein Bbelb_424800 [Branchiostoma belcheri]
MFSHLDPGTREPLFGRDRCQRNFLVYTVHVVFPLVKPLKKTSSNGLNLTSGFMNTLDLFRKELSPVFCSYQGRTFVFTYKHIEHGVAHPPCNSTPPSVPDRLRRSFMVATLVDFLEVTQCSHISPLAEFVRCSEEYLRKTRKSLTELFTERRPRCRLSGSRCGLVWQVSFDAPLTTPIVTAGVVTVTTTCR